MAPPIRKPLCPEEPIVGIRLSSRRLSSEIPMKSRSILDGMIATDPMMTNSGLLDIMDEVPLEMPSHVVEILKFRDHIVSWAEDLPVQTLLR